MNKRKLVEKFLNNSVGERVPCAFWYHFVSFHDHYTALENSETYKNVLDGQKNYYKKFDPDLVKIMSDGFFGHPSVYDNIIESTEDLKKIKSIGTEHEWIHKQIAYVKEITDYINEEVYTYYNIFSPLQYIRLKFEEYDEDFTRFVELFKKDPEKMYDAGLEIAQDIKTLIDELFSKTKVDGIYYSVQSVQSEYFDHEMHKKFVEPLDLMIMDKIREHTDNIMLHICGYGNYTNNLEWYSDYPAKVFNWSTHTEGINLKAGKEIFKDKPVLGGFSIEKDSILYDGSKEELKKEVYRLLEESGENGIALGADCTISKDINIDRLNYIKEACLEFRENKK